MLRQPFRLACSRIVLVVMWLTEKAKVFNLVVIWVLVQMSNLSGLHRIIVLKGKTNRASAATPREEVRFGCFRDLRAFRHVGTPTPSVSVLPNGEYQPPKAYGATSLKNSPYGTAKQDRRAHRRLQRLLGVTYFSRCGQFGREVNS